MSTYAIGDVQGCYRELMTLLEHINFNENSDRLWFAGDLVNRGPESLQTLRFIKQLGDNAVTVLGNHDLHLLAVAYGKKTGSSKDSLDSILAADDRDELLDWLRRQYLLITDEALAYTLLHAGLPPQWTIHQARKLASEVENIIRSDDFLSFLDVMYGDIPDQWDNALDGHDRHRFVINVLTRMRYCDTAGRIALKAKGPPEHNPIRIYRGLPFLAEKLSETKCSLATGQPCTWVTSVTLKSTMSIRWTRAACGVAN